MLGRCWRGAGEALERTLPANEPPRGGSLAGSAMGGVVEALRDVLPRCWRRAGEMQKLRSQHVPQRCLNGPKAVLRRHQKGVNTPLCTSRGIWVI